MAADTEDSSKWSDARFWVVAAVWLILSAGFVTLAIHEKTNPAVSALYTFISAALVFIAGQIFATNSHNHEISTLRSSHANEIRKLKAEGTRRVTELRRTGEAEARKSLAHQEQLDEERAEAMRNYATSAVQRLFRSRTSFIDINTTARFAVQVLERESLEEKRLELSNAIGVIAKVSEREMRSSPDLIDDWRRISKDAVDEQVQALERQQREQG